MVLHRRIWLSAIKQMSELLPHLVAKDTVSDKMEIWNLKDR